VFFIRTTSVPSIVPNQPQMAATVRRAKGDRLQGCRASESNATTCWPANAVSRSPPSGAREWRRLSYRSSKPHPYRMVRTPLIRRLRRSGRPTRSTTCWPSTESPRDTAPSADAGVCTERLRGTRRRGAKSNRVALPTAPSPRGWPTTSTSPSMVEHRPTTTSPPTNNPAWSTARGIADRVG